MKLNRTDHPIVLHVSIPTMESKLLDPLIKFTAIETNVRKNISSQIRHWLFEQLSLLNRSSSSSSSVFNLSMIITSVCNLPLFQTESSSYSAKPLLSLSRMARPSLIHILLPLMKVSPTRQVKSNTKDTHNTISGKAMLVSTPKQLPTRKSG